MRSYWLALVAILLAACTPSLTIVATPTPLPPPQTPQAVLIAGAETIAPTLQTLASVYQQRNAGIKITLIERADTLALQALEQGDANLIVSMGAPAQITTTLWTTPFARDGLAIIVNPQNGLPGLTLEQARQLFQGQVENWELWGGLPGSPQIVSREEASGEFILFQHGVMKDVRVASTAMLAPGSDAVLELVSSDPMAIGYLSSAHINDTVRALAISGIPPAPEAVSTGAYPLTYELYWVAMSDPQGAARDFVQWALGPEGQGIVAGHGFMPLSP
ncbi:MAG: substrate-binding domain-containing protein [Anaerolineae bacterium]|nr:substrate-binding domain-containing protein [Anaerolineae bacterium]